MTKRSLRIKDIDTERLYMTLTEISVELEVLAEEVKRMRRTLRKLLEALKDDTP
jgi:predicted ATP-grasp superfamily ATP-dependent carboligase